MKKTVGRITGIDKMKIGGYVYRVHAFNRLYYVCEQEKYELDALVKFEVKYRRGSEYTYIKGGIYDVDTAIE